MQSQTPSPRQPEVPIEQAMYDSVPYESYCYPQTHPDAMWVLGSLFRLDPPGFRDARILEIGCAAGGNVIPYALLYPACSIVGVDLSGVQIAHAIRTREALGARNLEFLQADITRLPSDIGKFDYVICHGVLSWVPKHVRDAIFAACRDLITPRGMALISYNTLPGWNAVRSLRDMMLFHTRSLKSPTEKVAQARALLDFLYENSPSADTAYRAIIDEERSLLDGADESYIFHDHLEVENHQFYLHEFVSTARDHELEYIGDSRLSTMFVGNTAARAREKLLGVSDAVTQEQYIDFLVNRRFRYSIVARADSVGRIDRDLKLEQVFSYHLEGNFQTDAVELNADGKMSFVSSRGGGSTLTSKGPEMAALLFVLARNTMPLSCEELIDAAAELVGKAYGAGIQQTLSEIGIPLALRGWITLHGERPAGMAAQTEKPEAFALARYQAGTLSRNGVTTTLRTTVAIDRANRVLLTALDGSRSKAELVNYLLDRVGDGALTVNAQATAGTDPADLPALAQGFLEERLAAYRRVGLLV